MKLRFLAVVSALFLLSVAVNADDYTMNFSGKNLHVVGEYKNGDYIVDTTSWMFANLFHDGKTISGSITYNTSQSDTDLANPKEGYYESGNLIVYIPELDLTAEGTVGSHIQISVFDDDPTGPVPHDDDQFFASVEGSVSFTSKPGISTPHRFHVFLFGDPSMLPDDHLPTAPLDWLRGDASFFYMDSGGNERQVLLQYTPSVPEPASLLLLGAGLCGLLLSTRGRIR